MNNTTENTPAPARRRLTDHQVNPANDRLTIEVLDEPGSGGAHHAYAVSGLGEEGNPFFRRDGKVDDLSWQDEKLIVFQNGPINEVGVNGITHEALLAILVDRMRSFQAGPYACRENALALTKLEEAMHWLHHRTRARMQRGVEGTHAK